jgi:hypothetical protein
MDDFEPDHYSLRNPLTWEKHRKEVLWQITVPVAIFTAIVVIVWLASWGLGYASASRWADISLIWLIVPILFAALIVIVLQAGMIYLLIRLMRVLPFYAYRTHGFLNIIGIRISSAGNRVVEPVLRVQSFQASLRSFGRALRRK